MNSLKKDWLLKSNNKMDINLKNKVREEFSDLIDKGILKVSFNEIKNSIDLLFRNCSISIYSANYNSSINCDVIYNGFQSNMPIVLIKEFIDQKEYKSKNYGINDYFEIIRANLDDFKQINGTPNWYFNWIKYLDLKEEVLTKLIGLDLSDPLRIKWQNHDENWKHDFKSRFKIQPKYSNDFFWSRI